MLYSAVEMAKTAAAASSRRMVAIVVALFFMSGASGLVYQVIWVRQFGNVFGNTVHSASLVTSVFMCGLGLGSYVVGRWSDKRRHSPRVLLKWYGYSEIAIGVIALLLAWLLPRLSAVSAAISSYEPGAHGWHELSTSSWLFRYVVATVLLAPPCLIMGGTLTLLIRALLGTELTRVAWRVGLLYGLNTAGAALGALLTDFWLVPGMGIFATQLLAAGVSSAAGLGAFALSWSSLMNVSVASAPQETARPARSGGPAQRRRLALMGGGLALLGLAAMGLEILWFRFLSQLLGSMRAVFSLLLATMLVGMWLGSMSAGPLHRRFGRAPMMLMMTQAALVLVTLATLGLIDHRHEVHAHVSGLIASGAAPSTFNTLWMQLRPIMLVVFLPGFLLGFSYPLANAHVQDAEQQVGQRAGLLYLGVTFGNVLGAAVTGFVLLPRLGVDVTLLVLLACVVTSIVPVWLSSIERTKRGRARRQRPLSLGVGLASLAACIAAFALARPNWLLRPAIPNSQSGTRKVLVVSEGLNETVAVADVLGLHRSLYTNGHSMSDNDVGSQRYMRAFVHIPLLQQEAPKSVLVICFGVGNTLHAASLHPTLQRLDVADLSEQVLDHATYFEETNRGVLKDPRVRVFVNDGRHHLQMQPEGTYDLITLEPPPITFAGVSALYSQEFYELARSRLTDGGHVTQWLPIYQATPETVLSLVKSFVNVFPESVLLSGFNKELILVGTTGEIALDLDGVGERLRSAPLVQEDLESIALASELQLAGTFVSAASTLRAATLDAPAITDDLPVLEYGAPSPLGTTPMPQRLFDVSKIAEWCPTCAARIPQLDLYLDYLGAYYQSPGFLKWGGAPRPGDLPDPPAALAEETYFRHLVDGTLFVKQRARAHLERGDLDAAMAALRRGALLNPKDVGVAEMMAEVLHTAGDHDGVIAMRVRAVELRPRSARVRAGLAAALRYKGEHVQATQVARAALALDATSADAHYELAAALSASGHSAESDASLAAALEHDPGHRKANSVLCKRKVKKGEIAAAVAHCDAAAAKGWEIPPAIAREIASERP